MSDLDELRSSTVEDDFDDDFGGFGDEVAFEGEGGSGSSSSGGFTSTERLIIAALVFLNVVALLFLLWMLFVG